MADASFTSILETGANAAHDQAEAGHCGQSSAKQEVSTLVGLGFP